jgi:hypothetical protein
MIPKFSWAGFLQHGKAGGSRLQPKRVVADKLSEGVLLFKVVTGDNEPFLPAKSRPKKYWRAYPDKWSPLQCEYCRFGVI